MGFLNTKDSEIKEKINSIYAILLSPETADKVSENSLLENTELNMLKYLVENGEQLKDIENQLLQRKSMIKNIDALMFLSDNGININTKEIFMTAIHSKRIYFLECLISNGNKLHLENCELLAEAVKTNNLNMVEYLVENGACIQSTDKCINPINQAIQLGNLDMVKLLLSKHDMKDLTPQLLVEASKSGHFHVLKELTAHGIPTDPVCKEGILESINNWHLPMVKFYITQGADQETKNESLLQAFLHSKFDIALYLMKEKADLFFNDNQIIKTVAASGNLTAVKGLVDLGADLNLAKEYGTEKIKQWTNNWKVVKQYRKPMLEAL